MSRDSKSNTQKLVDQKPWIRKPLELLFHAENHYEVGEEYDKRIAYISFDNSIEISIVTYMYRNCKPKGNKKYTEKDILYKNDSSKRPSFYDRLKEFEKIVKEKKEPERWGIDAINYYHEQRNSLYHESNISTPDQNDLDAIRQIAFWVFSILFEISDVKNALNELEAESEKMFPSISEDYVKPKVREIEQQHRTPLWIAAILGGWNENSSGDRNIIEEVIPKGERLDFDAWLHNIREIKKYNDEVLSLTDGYWQVKNKESALIEYTLFFYDNHLDSIKSISLKILAVARGKIPKYSPGLRKGISETLTFLAIHSSKLENCTRDKREVIVNSVIKELLDNADWKLWASLDDVLPILAEAAPDEFLASVENALKQSPCPFDELFQQGNNIINSYPMASLYWALEGLAWSKDYLSRSILALAGLAQHDPGGTWENRPANSITTILLPWFPQTVADADSRIGALRAVQDKYPDIAREVLLALLPNQTQQSLGSNKPKFRKFIPDDWKEKVLKGEYWEQVREYAKMAVDMAKEDIEYVPKLVENLDNIPEPAYGTLLEYLKSEEIKKLPDEQKQPIWENLKKNLRHSDCDIDLLGNIVEELAPSRPEIFYSHLFSGNDFEYREPEVDVETHNKMMKSKRIEALEKIYSIGGTDAIISFSNKVDAPYKVGWSFAEIADEESDNKLLPALLDYETSSEEQFIKDYVRGRYLKNGMNWLEHLEVSDWTNEQKCNLLLFLPFEDEIWQKVDELLEENVANYWSKVIVKPFPSKSNLLPAINNLLKYNRPYFALECISAHYDSKTQLLKEQAIKALLDGLSSNEDVKYLNSTSSYYFLKIIKLLQDDPDVKEDDLLKIEWGYLPLLLNRREGEGEPKFLEKRLSQEPEYFIEIIKLMYRSKKAPMQDEEISEERKKLAGNAWKLLNHWQRPPGMQDDGSFSDDELINWYEKVKNKTKELGYYEVAMTHLGHVLFYSGEDINGLWIKESVAELLNKEENEEMRKGFVSEVFNSRGVYSTDPLGESEKKIADLWHTRARGVDEKGYAHFATSLRDLAKSYERDAERIIAEHKNE